MGKSHSARLWNRKSRETPVFAGTEPGLLVDGSVRSSPGPGTQRGSSWCDGSPLRECRTLSEPSADGSVSEPRPLHSSSYFSHQQWCAPAGKVTVFLLDLSYIIYHNLSIMTSEHCLNRNFKSLLEALILFCRSWMRSVVGNSVFLNAHSRPPQNLWKNKLRSVYVPFLSCLLSRLMICWL